MSEKTVIARSETTWQSKTMLKIEYIIGSLEVGGAERHLSLVLPALARMGFFITVHVLSDKATLKPLFDSAGIRVRLGANFDFLPSFLRKPLRLITSVLRLMLSFLKNRKAIRHAFLPEAYLLASIAARLTFFSGPLVMSRRSLNDYQKRYPFFSNLERYFHRFTTIALGNSLAVVNQLYEEGFERGKVGLIYNGIDVWPYQNLPTKNELRKNLAIAEEDLVFIILANLIPYKGHADLLNAFGMINQQMPKDWKLFCVGKDTGIMKDLKKQARALGIEKNVEFLGRRSDTIELLSAADIGVLCSHEEGFSNAILESMAAGLPMVVTNVGGNAEAIDDMCNGLVVAAKQPAALAEGLLSMALSSELRSQFSQAAKIKIHNNFTLQKCAQQYFDFYISLAKLQLTNMS